MNSQQEERLSHEVGSDLGREAVDTPLVSIIIVNWNTRELLADCLQSVYETVHDCLFEVFVVDNASTDGSAAMVRERFPDVRLIENADNVGFARANNQAIRESVGKYVLLLNPDAVLFDDAATALVLVLETLPHVGIVSPQLLNPDGTLQESWNHFPTLFREIPFVNRLIRRGPGPAIDVGCLTVHEVDWVSGACFLIRRQVLDSIGGLDESFWLYTEETDFCYRARIHGHRVAFVADAHVRHARRAASSQRMVVSMLWYYQSRVRFSAKHYSGLHAALHRDLLWLKALMWEMRPNSSPLRAAYADAPTDSIKKAYRQLRRVLTQPVGSLLALRW